MSELLASYVASNSAAERETLRSAMLHLHVVEVVKYHGIFSSLDLVAFDEHLAEGCEPMYFRRTRTELVAFINRVSPTSQRSKSVNKVTPKADIRTSDIPRRSGEVVSGASLWNSTGTIKGTSSAPFVPLRSTSSTTLIPLTSASSGFLDEYNLVPAAGTQSDAPSNSDSMIPSVSVTGLRDDIQEAEQVESLDSVANIDLRKLTKRELEQEEYAALLAKYDHLKRVTVKFSADTARKMRKVLGKRELTPILENQVLATYVLLEEGMADEFTGNLRYRINKFIFEQFEVAFGTSMQCIWKLEFTPVAGTKMVCGHMQSGTAHVHFYLSEPDGLSSYPRKSPYFSRLSGYTFAQWFERVVRIATKTVSPKKRNMTHVPTGSARPERPKTIDDQIAQMLGYFAKQGRTAAMRAKQIQNHIPFDLLDRGETNLRMYGFNALDRI
ncbi:hypothetical protein [Arthrobacter sp. CDRTa11]|uniref:hypothetical protein n=1 Tax=Arthrobacter sp. CDRTa11 TaxID=2651199 RepID=UPI002265C1B2|nr:hypothetical protein [Arthrobacter sp. CDRTa11]